VQEVVMTELRVGTLADERILYGPFEERRALLDRAAAIGLDHVFVADHISFRNGFGMDGLVQAALATATQPTLGVHVGVYLLALRHPVAVARQLSTLCAAAPGRITLGVGVGGEDRHEIEICGVDPATRGRRTDACLAALRGLLAGEACDFESEFFGFEAAQILPAPDPPPRIVIGGRSAAAIQRTSRFGDGWLATWCSARRFADVTAEISQRARAAGRPDVAWRHGLQVWAGFDADRGRARERLAARMLEMYGIPFGPFEKYSPYGSPRDVADFLAPYLEAGCEDINLMGVAASTEATLEAVAEVRERLLAARGVPDGL
jgi:alkanesulfonate monooxygenase SsuD/methylene tetrahydromethanopterin reductase-like flavin-dependent oxidoreductase (luciferase family)